MGVCRPAVIFNFDFNVSFLKDEDGRAYNFGTAGPGKGVAPWFELLRARRDVVFTPYSMFARGLDTLIGTYNYLDHADWAGTKEEPCFHEAAKAPSSPGVTAGAARQGTAWCETVDWKVRGE